MQSEPVSVSTASSAVTGGTCPRFSIVIPTWKNLEYLDLAWRALKKYSATDHEIIVFFNEMDNADRQWVEGKGLVWEGSDRNLGVCEAVNRAARRATTGYICFFNDDMVALPGWDTAFAACLGMAKPLWLSGTAVEAGRATTCYLGGHDFGASPSDFRERDILAACAMLARPYHVVSTWTPTLLAHADWDAVGGLDEAYFPGNGSDPDLAMKMYQYGCRHFVGVGNSLVYHFSRKTTGRFDGVPGMDPKKYFERKWGMSWSYFLHRVLQRGERITPELLAELAAGKHVGLVPSWWRKWMHRR